MSDEVNMKGHIPPVRHSGVHHSAICTRDWDESMRFWVDGMGLEPLFELPRAEGAWTTLFAASGNTLRSGFLHDPVLGDAGIVELVEFPTGIADGTPVEQPAVGFFLLSFYVDVDAVLGRMAALGLGGTPRRIEVPGPTGPVAMGVVRDPNGVLVELIGLPTSR